MLVQILLVRLGTRSREFMPTNAESHAHACYLTCAVSSSILQLHVQVDYSPHTTSARTREIEQDP